MVTKKGRSNWSHYTDKYAEAVGKAKNAKELRQNLRTAGFNLSPRSRANVAYKAGNIKIYREIIKSEQYKNSMKNIKRALPNVLRGGSINLQPLNKVERLALGEEIIETGKLGSDKIAVKTNLIKRGFLDKEVQLLTEKL
ncbi:hypothetical protein H0N95_00490 [Candidatus Micrarchaeota archaeon]|nr:hypothetical protein [Candidatus Micrarchaeota archaeon]